MRPDEDCDSFRVYGFITAVPITKLVAWGEGDSARHVLRETTSRGLCGLAHCTLVNAGERESGGKKEGEKKGSARGSVQGACDYATALNIEVEPQCRCFGRRESDFALQGVVESRALEKGTSTIGCFAMAFQRQ